MHTKPQPLAQPRLLDIKGAAAYLSTTVWCMRSLVWDKKLPAIRLGKRLLFDIADLDRFVDGLKKAS
jgi:excisionase family DNA binding protein